MADELAPERVAQLIETGAAQVVDVRTHEEREAAHVPNTAHIPIEALEEMAPEVLDRERAVVLLCRSGDRSAVAADAFRASGWEASSMSGGILAWKESGLPLEPAGGEVVSPSGLPPK